MPSNDGALPGQHAVMHPTLSWVVRRHNKIFSERPFASENGSYDHPADRLNWAGQENCHSFAPPG